MTKKNSEKDLFKPIYKTHHLHKRNYFSFHHKHGIFANLGLFFPSISEMLIKCKEVSAWLKSNLPISLCIIDIMTWINPRYRLLT